jgi:hypothetical protein
VRARALESATMTKEQIDAIFERVRTWPLERQEDAAQILLRMEEQNKLFEHLTEEDWADLEEALAEAEREEPVPDEEVRALFDRYRRP